MLITHARIFNGSEFITGPEIRIRDGIITEADSGLRPVPGEEKVDLAGDYLLPGFVDVHIHAYRGQDTMQGENAVRTMSRELRKLGVEVC